MKFSVIITCYNNGDCVLDAVASVRDQVYADWELIVVDDASQDDSVVKLKHALRNCPRARVIVLPENSGGPARPRNIGVEAATGDWVAFLDADDIWHRDKLRLQAEAIQATQACIVSSAKVLFNRAEVGLAAAAVDLPEASKTGRWISYRSMLFKNWLCTSSVVMTRDLASACPFPEVRRYRAIEDYRVWLDSHKRVAQSFRLDIPLVYYRIHAGSISKDKWGMIKKNWMLYREYFSGWRRVVLPPCMMVSYVFFSALLQVRLGRGLCASAGEK